MHTLKKTMEINTLLLCLQIKKVLTKYTKLWDETKYLIKTINDGEAGEHEKDFLKIKFDSDDNLSLNKKLQLHNLTIVIRCFSRRQQILYTHFFT